MTSPVRPNSYARRLAGPPINKAWTVTAGIVAVIGVVSGKLPANALGGNDSLNRLSPILSLTPQVPSLLLEIALRA